jgi:hypothetical protein
VYPCYTVSMSTRNITLSLPVELIRAGRIFAAEHDTTLNALLREMLAERLQREGKMKEAVATLLDLAKNGPLSDVDPRSFRREDLYERR